jgi:hypothetical protein
MALANTSRDGILADPYRETRVDRRAPVAIPSRSRTLEPLTAAAPRQGLIE